MKRVFLYTTALLLLSMGLQAQDQSHPSPYADVLAGISPNFGNDGLNVHLSIGIGMQFSNWSGLGLSLVNAAHATVSTNYSFSGLGLQYRLLTPKHRQVLKLELGHLLGYKYTTDYTDEFRYEAGFDPYFKAYLGHRIRRFTFGLTYTHAAGIQEGIWAYDDVLRDHVDTEENRSSRFDLLQLFIGFSLDDYPAGRRKKK